MVINIKTKFGIGDIVFMIFSNKIAPCRVDSIRINAEEGIISYSYSLYVLPEWDDDPEEGEFAGYYEEDSIISTFEDAKKELIESVLESETYRVKKILK